MSGRTYHAADWRYPSRGDRMVMLAVIFVRQFGDLTARSQAAELVDRIASADIGSHGICGPLYIFCQLATMI